MLPSVTSRFVLIHYFLFDLFYITLYSMISVTMTTLGTAPTFVTYFSSSLCQFFHYGMANRETGEKKNIREAKKSIMFPKRQRQKRGSGKFGHHVWMPVLM